jgi:hypothetical protein
MWCLIGATISVLRTEMPAGDAVQFLVDVLHPDASKSSSTAVPGTIALSFGDLMLPTGGGKDIVPQVGVGQSYGSAGLAIQAKC